MEFSRKQTKVMFTFSVNTKIDCESLRSNKCVECNFCFIKHLQSQFFKGPVCRIKWDLLAEMEYNTICMFSSVYDHLEITIKGAGPRLQGSPCCTAMLQ